MTSRDFYLLISICEKWGVRPSICSRGRDYAYDGRNTRWCSILEAAYHVGPQRKMKSCLWDQLQKRREEKEAGEKKQLKEKEEKMVV